MILTISRRHIKRHVKPVLCPYCPMRSAEQRDMRNHVDTHKHQDARIRFPCPVCGQKFTLQYNNLRHQNQAHGVRAQM